MNKPVDNKRVIVGAALGDCVHVGGIYKVLQLSRDEGWEPVFLGPAQSIERVIDAIREHQPELVAISYRLTPETGHKLLLDFREALRKAGLWPGLRLAFGGTTPVCRRAEEVGIFEATFDGHTTPEDVKAYLRGEQWEGAERRFPQALGERIRWKAPYPLIRAHYGQPTMSATIAGIEQIADAQVLDVVSLGIDQNAQECFFRPDEMDPTQHGAGGVPVRTAQDYVDLKAASRRGNFPLMRCYAGTRDLLPMAKLQVETIDNAWAAIPMFWYSELDGRSTRPLDEVLTEAQQVMRWYAEQGRPVESNDSHHWSLRDAPDVVAVAAAYIVALNAKAMGVSEYVSQFMFNTPNATSFRMDLAKMLAKAELIDSLVDDTFTVYRETRAGLTSLPADLDQAKGQLASSTMLQMALKPDIVHIVSYSEADHAATHDVIIESARIVQGVINNCVHDGLPDMTLDPVVQRRKRELLDEAAVLLGAIRALGDPARRDDPDYEPLADPRVLYDAVAAGLLDAPHLSGRRPAQGLVVTRFVDGACVAVHPETGAPLTEAERHAWLREHVAPTVAPATA